MTIVIPAERSAGGNEIVLDLVKYQISACELHEKPRNPRGVRMCWCQQIHHCQSTVLTQVESVPDTRVRYYIDKNDERWYTSSRTKAQFCLTFATVLLLLS